jgi:hypothetical protein
MRLGLAGLRQIIQPRYTAETIAALMGAVYYGLAGINHCFHKGRNQLQNVALVSDLFAASVLAICCFA